MLCFWIHRNSSYLQLTQVLFFAILWELVLNFSHIEIFKSWQKAFQDKKIQQEVQDRTMSVNASPSWHLNIQSFSQIPSPLMSIVFPVLSLHQHMSYPRAICGMSWGCFGSIVSPRPSGTSHCRAGSVAGHLLPATTRRTERETLSHQGYGKFQHIST